VGNPFVIGRDRATVIEKYRRWIKMRLELMASLHELQGRVLFACEYAPKLDPTCISSNRLDLRVIADF
jgi:hypothetical protein